MGALGDMNAYMRFKAARAVGDAAQQQGAGGLAGAGLGLGAGVGLGGVLGGTMAQAFQPQPAGAPAAPDDVLKQLDGLRAQGILSEEEYQAKRQEYLARSQPEQSVPDLLKQLAALRDQGVLTAEEFEAKKKELLSRL